MPVLNPQITQDGLNAALLSDGVSVFVKLSYIKFGTGISGDGYTPDGTESDLETPVGVATVYGNKISPTQIRMTAVWKDNIGTTPITELGFFDENDILFAVFSDEDYTNTDPIFFKSNDVDFVEVYDLILAGVPLNSVTVVEDDGLAPLTAVVAEHIADTEAHPQYLKKTHHIWCDSATGTANALILTPQAGSEFLDYEDGQRLSFRAVAINTGAVTIETVGIAGTKALNLNGSALTGGELQTNVIYDIIYDNNHYNLQSSELKNATTTIAGRIKTSTVVLADAAADTTTALTPASIVNYKTRIEALESSIGTQFTRDFYSDNTVGYPASTYLDAALLAAMNVGESVFVKDASSAVHGSPVVVGGDTSITYEPAWAIYRKISVGAVLGTNIIKVSEQGVLGITIGVATESDAGIAETATDDEMETGEDDERISTPLKIRNLFPRREFDLQRNSLPAALNNLFSVLINNNLCEFYTNTNGLVELIQTSLLSPTTKHFYTTEDDSVLTNQVLYVGVMRNLAGGNHIIICRKSTVAFEKILYKITYNVTTVSGDVTELKIVSVVDFRQETNEYQAIVDEGISIGTNVGNRTWAQAITDVATSTSDVIILNLETNLSIPNSIGTAMVVPSTCRAFIIDLNGKILTRDAKTTAQQHYIDGHNSWLSIRNGTLQVNNVTTSTGSGLFAQSKQIILDSVNIIRHDVANTAPITKLLSADNIISIKGTNFTEQSTNADDCVIAEPSSADIFYEGGSIGTGWIE